MQTSPRGRLFIQGFEKCRLTAYPDPGTKSDPWTIGFGHTGPGVKPGMMCTQDQADAWFEEDLAGAEQLINDHVTVPLTQGQFDALVSLVYNVGPGRAGHRDGIITLANGNPSTLLRKLNAGDYVGSGQQIKAWNKAGGVVMNGLTSRRNGEYDMFCDTDTEDA